MKKNLLVFLMLVVASVFGAKAQTALVATLNHGGKISAYYGSQAFIQAHEAAEHGDIITLSSGGFEAPNITKAVTVRGAGMYANKERRTEETMFTNDFNIGIANDTPNFKMEGVHTKTITFVSGTFADGTFVKCRIENINNDWYGRIYNASFIQCVIGELDFPSYHHVSMEFKNCLVRFTHIYWTTPVLNFNHCTLINPGDEWGIDNITGANFTNCILIGEGSDKGGTVLHESCRATNCLIANTTDENPYGEAKNDNWVLKDVKNIMSNFTYDNLDPANFKLTSMAQDKYVGTDGTPLGMYGGSLPFDPEPSTPHITNLSVSSKSTSSGTISVGLRVNSGK